MGRTRTTNKGLPRGLQLKDGRYYHVTTVAPRKWTPLGRDRAAALLAWARLEGTEPDPSARTFEVVALRYAREVIPTKARRTQQDNVKELERLRAVFGRVQIDAIKPHHVRAYMDKRGEAAKARANREKALLSHVFNKAREWGFTSAANPCQGVKGFKEAGRDRYVTDDEFRAVWEHAHPAVQDAMDLALLTGQRPADVLKIRHEDVRDGALWVVQNKTGARRAIELSGELAALVARIEARPRARSGPWLIKDEDGQRLSATTLRSRFDKARRLAGVSFQFRDLRAKAATDTGDLAHSQKLLGHTKRDMTEHYVKRRIGEKVKPLR
ncbi:tyrosine-type recombinase/integrase [uncultured Azohydromonas sp.]|mgnify:CR=1 FL=1|jgi:Phage integrase family.|uniref:tyrosine-type recombinase/integrase n=1 Tax=uncultured Azohydromonas sp. TaxID=487342 RepID=UPI00261F0EEF|nr:tyrosine-type recombinase/integrase [uncultured Azohydromonas sp.]